MRLRRANKGVETALFYYDAYTKTPFDAKIQAEYAFAAFASDQNMYDPEDSPHQRRLRDQLHPHLAIATDCRIQSIKAFPNDPTVLLMSAMYETETDNFANGLTISEKAIKLDPNWAYARYWCGRTCINLAGKTEDQEKKKFSNKVSLILTKHKD